MADTAWIYELYRRIEAGDSDGAAAFFAEDALFEIPCIGRRVNGRTAIASFIRGFSDFSSDEHDEVEAAVSDGGMFAVHGALPEPGTRTTGSLITAERRSANCARA